ncbi:MAG: hypothetical protein R8G66_01295 [Cytophagales bacterium]|nr:hypothetical protein [Cytophagales bacterium]
MRRLLVIKFILLLNCQAFCQQEDLELDFPEMPTSPAFILMGVSPTDIESPGSASDLTTAIQNATGNLTSIPDNFFLTVNPFWVFNTKHVSYSKYSAGGMDRIRDNILQSLQISVGVSDSLPSDNFDQRIGIGMKFSLIRGNIDSDIEDNYFKKLANYNTEVNRLVTEASNNDLKSLEIQSKMDAVAEQISIETDSQKRTDLENEWETLNQKLNSRSLELFDLIKSQHLKDLRKSLKDIELNRIGFYSEIAGGLTYDRMENDTKIYSSGVWANIGYQSNKTNFIGLIRFMTVYDQPIMNEMALDTMNLTSIDFGLKLDYQVEKKVSASGEFIYRAIPNTEIKSTYRLAFNLSYNITPDVGLNFTYGKGFEAILNEESDFFTLMSLAFGIGKKRKLDLTGL